MNVLQQNLIMVGVAGLAGLITANPAQALGFSFFYTNITTENFFDADLRLLSGGDPDFVGAEFQTPFNLDDNGEFFELFVEKNSLGRYACYSAADLTDLEGVLYENIGCDFDITLSSLTSIFQALNLDFFAAIADGSLLIETLFTGESDMTQGYSLETILTTYYQTPSPEPLPTPVPAPLAVLPIVSGLLLKARGDRPEKSPNP